MARRLRPSLGQLYAVSLAGLAVAFIVLGGILVEGTRRAVLVGSGELRRAAARRVESEVVSILGVAEQAVLDTERAIRRGALDPSDGAALEAALYRLLLAEPALSEVTLVEARLLGHDDDGQPRLAGGARRQVSVFRLPTSRRQDSGERLVTYTLERGSDAADVSDRGWTQAIRLRPAGGLFDSAPLQPVAAGATDPTWHATFSTPASRAFYGQLLWSDLSWSPLPFALLERVGAAGEGAGSGAASAARGLPGSGRGEQGLGRMVVVSVQKAIEGPQGRFLGVLRAGLFVDALDRVAAIRVAEGDADDPHRVFLCDPRTAALVTRTGPEDGFHVIGSAAEGLAIRVIPHSAPPEIERALADPALATLARDSTVSEQAARFEVEGEGYLATFRRTVGGFGWAVGVVVPEDHYLGALARLRGWALALGMPVLALLVLGGGLVLRTLRRGLGDLAEESGRMARFDFKARPPQGRPIEEVARVRDGLERAKAALRAMQRYVPTELVRDLYEEGQEPVLGCAAREVTLLFSDIEGFTSISERVAPAALAAGLGDYLAVMTGAIHSTRGTIDKFIGDAVMAVWNAPRYVDAHGVRACRAALAAQAALEELFATDTWRARGLPPFRTRLGIHRDEVLMGHFGAPERLSYTALGDGVNVAARLEGLNKLYGTQVLVSRAVYEVAKEDFVFRLVDRVAVKGRRQGLWVYELCGPAGDPIQEHALAYEDALTLYFEGSFVRAAMLFEALAPQDPPSRILASRCRQLIEAPPPADWDGVYVALAK